MNGAITAPRGFRAAAVAAGIKPEGADLALLAADWGCAAAAVFTTNRAQAAPVLVSREHLSGGRAKAVVVNSGCANAATGEQGLADAREMAALTARELGCRAGIPCFRSDRLSTAGDGTPVVYDRVFIPGDRFRITRDLQYDTFNRSESQEELDS